MGKDSQGINRGKCFEPGCDCDDFVIHKKGTKCNNCGHVPTIHVKMRFETVNPPGGSLESGSKDDEEIEKSCKDASEDPNDDLAVRIRSISVDSQGISRGECTITGCKCKQFSYIAQQRGIRCSWCGHPPTKHVASVPKLDTKRREGDEYEKDSRHTKLFTSRYGQLQNSKKSPELSSPLPVSDIEEDQIDSQFHTQQQEQTYAHVPTNAVSNVPPPQNVPQPSVWQQKICKLDGCSRPVRMEHNGKVHDFCCITHADEFNCKLVTVSAHLKCYNPSCGKMRWFDGTKRKYFDYCGITCRDRCRELLPAAGPQVAPDNICLLPGCSKQKYFNATNNTYFDYCGKSHAGQAQNGLVIQKATGQEFEKIKAHFTNQWCKGVCGQLHEVLVINNFKLKDKFQKYQSNLSVKKVSQHYHGTSLKCAIYQSFTVCSDETCGICGISKKGMLSTFKAKNIKFQRFGSGFYLAPNSSKCHDYTQGYDKYRAMLLFDVAEGKKHIVTNDQTKLTAPPYGYDSVYGQNGGSLNYDEIVLYKSAALLPTHIVVYEKDGIHKIAT